MNIQLNTLAEFISDNGYDVCVKSTEQVTLFNVIHHMSNREAAYGFDRKSANQTIERIAMEYCTDEQIIRLLEIASQPKQFEVN